MHCFASKVYLDVGRQFITEEIDNLVSEYSVLRNPAAQDQAAWTQDMDTAWVQDKPPATSRMSQTVSSDTDMAEVWDDWKRLLKGQLFSQVLDLFPAGSMSKSILTQLINMTDRQDEDFKIADLDGFIRAAESVKPNLGREKTSEETRIFEVRDELQNPIEQYPDLFATHVWDGAQHLFLQGMEAITDVGAWGSLKTWLCLFSNNQFDVSSASFMSAKMQKKMISFGADQERLRRTMNEYIGYDDDHVKTPEQSGGPVITSGAEGGEMYWQGTSLQRLFMEVSAGSERFAWFGQTKIGEHGPTGFDSKTWSWNFPELLAYLDPTICFDCKNLAVGVQLGLKTSSKSNFFDRLQRKLGRNNFVFSDEEGKVFFGEEGVQQLQNWLVANYLLQGHDVGQALDSIAVSYSNDAAYRIFYIFKRFFSLVACSTPVFVSDFPQARKTWPYVAEEYDKELKLSM